jgi:hypothetical protein
VFISHHECNSHRYSNPDSPISLIAGIDMV